MTEHPATDAPPDVWLAALRAEAQRLRAQSLPALVAASPTRLNALCKTAGPLTADFVKQRLDERTLSLLTAWADARGLTTQTHALFAGARVNATEDRPALHPSLRATDSASPLAPTLHHQTEQMLQRAERLRQGAMPGFTGQSLQHLVCLGIGGSDLGPRLVFDALHTADDFDVRFVANVDPDELERALHKLDPARTAFAVISKTFTTRETLANAAAARAWLRAGGCPEASLPRQFIGVTACPDRARAWGIAPDLLLNFHEGIGGRYSLWSSVGLGIAVGCGRAVFQALLAGAAELDQHFLNTPIPDNLPALMGLISVWNRTFLAYPTQAIVPYAERLHWLPAWLQQLVMESNGKSTCLNGQPCALPTAPIIWGGAGTNAQHAFFQQLHQGPDIVPVDFITARTSRTAPAFEGDDRHRILVANCLAQSAALAWGDPAAIADPHRALPGGRPSTVITLPQLEAHSLGALLACYEHATFTAAVLLGINPFDQFGVEYGKLIAQTLEQALAGLPQAPLDPATQALITRLRS